MKNFLKNEIKDTKQLFKTLNISQQTLSAEQRNSLNDKGFVIIPPTAYILKNLKKHTQMLYCNSLWCLILKNYNQMQYLYIQM